MNWLNLETNILHSPEFIGCKPTARATWLAVSLWCAGQENGGRIAGASTWGNRQWQQTCGVMLKEVMDAAPLLTWDGDTLIVWRYPEEREAEVKANREAGRNGGSSKTQAKTQAARVNGTKGGRPKTQAETQAEEPKNPSGNPTEWKGIGKEGNGREEEDTASAFHGPSRLTWLARVESLGHRAWWERKWFSAEKTGWMSGRNEIRNWETHQDSQMGYFQSFLAEETAKNAPPDTAVFEAQQAAEKARREAKELELQREQQALFAGERE